MPVVLRYHPSANRESRKNDRGEIVDRKLAQLNHEAKNAGERPALRPPEPGRVHFDHAGRAEGLHVAIHQPDRGESCKSAGEGSKAEDQIDNDGSCGADQHGGLAANPVGKQTVHELSGPVSKRPGAQHSGNLESAEPKLRHHARSREPEIIPAHIKRGIEQSDDKPVQAPARTETGRIFDRDLAHVAMTRGRMRDWQHDAQRKNGTE